MSRQNEERPSRTREEPLFLSLLPFAGLAALVLLALVWRHLPASESGARASDVKEDGPSAVERWERERERDIPLSPERDFSLGPPDAPITLVEFSDFECPYCRTAAIQVDRLLERFGDRVRFVFKNLPLDTACNDAMRQQLHAFACHAARVARCAGRQGDELFWKTHDALYRATQFSDEILRTAALEAGAEARALDRCLESGEVLEEIRADIAEAHEMRITGTPTFFLNGRQVAEYRDGALERIAEHVLAETPGR